MDAVSEEQHSERGPVIQDFATGNGAAAAIRALQQAGFDNASISVVARDEAVAHDIAQDTHTGDSEAVESAVTGMTAGGVLGAAGALLVGATTLAVPGLGLAVGGPLIGALAGGAGGGLIGGLIGLGIANDEAEYYAGQAGMGRILVIVEAASRAEEARDIMSSITLNEDAEAGLYADPGDSTGNTILDQGIISHTMGITPPVDTVAGQEPDEGYTTIAEEPDIERP